MLVISAFVTILFSLSLNPGKSVEHDVFNTTQKKQIANKSEAR